MSTGEAVYVGGDATASWTQAHPTKSLAAITTTTCSRDPPILDVGGGSSPLAAELLSAGYTDLTVLDLSSAALKLARQRLGDQADRINWIAADVLAWKPERRYAVWHDRALLHFFTDRAREQRFAWVVAQSRICLRST